MGALVHEEQVLLVHRRSDKLVRPGVWDLPGGVREAGETALGALPRELHEELGVRIATGSVVPLGDSAAGPENDPARVRAWVISRWEGTPTNVAPEEHDGIGWFSLADLPLAPHVILRAALINAMRS